MHAYQHDASAICLSGQYQASTGPIQPSEARHRPARGQYSHQRLDEGQHGAEYARDSSSGLPILCTRAKHRRLTSLRQRTSCSQSHTTYFPPRAPRPSPPELRKRRKRKAISVDAHPTGRSHTDARCPQESDWRPSWQPGPPLPQVPPPGAVCGCMPSGARCP